MATELLNTIRVCPVFLTPQDPSFRFRVFWGGWRVRMSIKQTAENLKIGKIGAKIRASVYLKALESVFPKKCYEVLKL